MPAPIAPPARARPPPTNAPAVLMADSMVVAATVSPWFRAGRRRNGCTSGAASACSGRELWGWFLVVVVLAVGVRLVGLLVVVMAGPGHPEVQDGQQREDERLEPAEEHGVEELPDHAEDHREQSADRDVTRCQRHQGADQGD